MLAIIFMFAMFWFAWKLFVFGLKAAWGIAKILVTVLFFPLIIVGMVALVCIGLISLAIPILISSGIIALLGSLITALRRGCFY